MRLLARRTALLLIVALVATTAGCFAAPATTLRGHVTLALPVAGASVQVEDLRGELLAAAGAPTDARGFFEVEVRGLPRDFRIVASEGTVLGVPHEGTLAVEVRDRAPDGQSFYELNPVTTLISRHLAAQPDQTLEQARARVQAFLDVPAFVDLTDGVVYAPDLFDPVVFAREAAVEGGFESFVATLVAEMEAGGTRRFSSAARGADGDPPRAAAGGSAAGAVANLKGGLKGIGGVLVGGTVGTFVDMAISYLFDQLFASGGEDRLGEISAQLAELQEDLRAISAQLGEISATLSEVQQTVNETNLGVQALLWNNAITTAQGSVVPINSVYREMHMLVHAAAIADNAEEMASYGAVAGELRETNGPILHAGTGVLRNVRDLNEQIVGTAGPSLLSAHLDRILQQVPYERRYEQREEMYTSLEAFFLGLVAVQLKGVYLIADARKARGEHSLGRLFLAEFYSEMLRPQTDQYLATVEELTLHHADLRWSESMPDVHATYLARADHLVQELLNAFDVDELSSGVFADPERLALTARIMTEGGRSAATSVTFTGAGGQEVRADRVRSGAARVVQDQGVSYHIVRYVAHDVPPGAYTLSADVHGLYARYPVQVSSGGAANSVAVAALLPEPDRMYQIANKHSGKVLEFAGPTTENGGRVQQWEADGSASQRWEIAASGGRISHAPHWMGSRTAQPYAIVNVYERAGAGRVMDVAGYGLSHNTPVHQWTWHAGGNQRWVLYNQGAHAGYGQLDPDWVGAGAVPTERSMFMLRATHSPLDDRGRLYYRPMLLLSILDQATFNGAGAVIHRKSAEENPLDARWWRLELQSNGDYLIRNVQSGKVLEVVGPSTADGARLQQFPWRDIDSQKWTFQYQGEGYFSVVNVHSRRIARGVRYSVLTATTKSGWPVQQWTWLSQDRQLWRLDQVGAGSLRMMTQGGRVLETLDAQRADGASIVTDRWGDRDHQKWTLTPR